MLPHIVFGTMNPTCKNNNPQEIVLKFIIYLGLFSFHFNLAIIFNWHLAISEGIEKNVQNVGVWNHNSLCTILLIMLILISHESKHANDIGFDIYLSFECQRVVLLFIKCQSACLES